MSPWESLVREHLPVVTGVALRILGDRSAAEDVAQDLFLHLLQNPHALDGAQNVRSFLCRSAINRSLDRLREKERRDRREAAFPQATRDLNPLDAAFNDEIRRSVEALPQDERDAIAARFFRGLTVREAAKEMRVSVGTVCNRLEAGVKRLRKWLGAASFALLCMVFDDDAFADEIAGGVERVASRGRQSGVGRQELGVGRAGQGQGKGKGKGLVAVGVGLAALVLISIWLGRPGEIAGADDRATEMASAGSTGSARTPTAEAGRSDSMSSEVAARPDSRPRGEMFRAEGFLVRDGDGYALVEPSLRDPKKVEGPATGALAIAAGRGDSFCLLPDLTADRRPFRLRRGSLLDSLHAGEIPTFADWLDGLTDASRIPRVRLALRAEWIDRDAGLADAVEIEETESLGDAWLAAWREALRANAALGDAFERPPGAQRRADVIAALDDLEKALGRARDARGGETAVSWRIRRESEIEIASAGAVACLGREVESIEDGSAPDPEDFAASRAVGLELEIVPAIQRGALALRGGARIVSVVPGSAADRAGLRAGDIVWRVTPLAGAGRSAAHDVVRPEDVAAFVADVVETGGSGLEFEIVRGLDSFALELKL